MLAFLLLFLLICYKRRKRGRRAEDRGRGRRKKGRESETGRPGTTGKSAGGPVTGDTAEMPAIPYEYLEQDGFRVVEDITYIHTEGRIT